VDESGQPETRLHIGAPAIEMEVPAGVAVPVVRAIEANDVEILIFHPDASHEAPLVILLGRRHVKYEAAYFAEKFAANIIKLIVLLVEAVGINKNHLQEAVGQELHRKA